MKHERASIAAALHRASRTAEAPCVVVGAPRARRLGPGDDDDDDDDDDEVPIGDPPDDDEGDDWDDDDDDDEEPLRVHEGPAALLRCSIATAPASRHNVARSSVPGRSLSFDT